jgi:CHAT domain-containing protein
MYDGTNFLCMKYYVGRALVVETDSELSTTRLSRETENKLRIALVIDPTETLPAAAKEAQLKEALERLGRVDVYRGKSVDMLSGMRLFGQGYDIIHFAGHAEFDADNPNESSLGFADGKLKAYHIKEMIEKSGVIPRLVFVNACTSARESVETELDYHGYKIRGLASLFLHAGVSGYVGTTWTIFDESAQFLAAEFYAGILGGEPIGMALTEARRKTFERYPDDLSWASFVLYGDPGANPFDKGQ